MYKITRSLTFTLSALFKIKSCRTMTSFSTEIYINDLHEIFLRSVSSVNSSQLVRSALQIDETGKTLKVLDHVFHLTANVYLVGFGKAVLGMGYECAKILDNNLRMGVLSIPVGGQKHFGSKLDRSKIRIFEGAFNNLPDINSELAAREIYGLAKGLDKRDTLIVLVSGGGSALLPLPVPEISLSDKINTIKLLQSVGADITELNTVRKVLSITKGGGLAEAAYPCKVITLIVSDIISDPLDFISSGCTVLNTDSQTAPLEIIQKYRLDFKIPKHVLDVLKIREKRKTEIPISQNNYEHVNNFVIGNNSIALNTAIKTARDLKYSCLLLSKEVNGFVGNVALFYSKLCFEICEMLKSGKGKDMNHLIRKLQVPYELNFNINPNFTSELLRELSSFSKTKGLCIISGGETTVQINGPGKGGRNQELSLLFSQYIHEIIKDKKDMLNSFDFFLLCAGTDGIDGPTDVAGAIGTPDIINCANDSGLNVDGYLAQSDSYHFLSKIKGGKYFVKTGHTGTNVMDIYIILITPKYERKEKVCSL